MEMLRAAGFKELDDTIPYTGKLVPGGKYYFTRNKSTLVAFTVGEQVRRIACLRWIRIFSLLLNLSH